MNPYEEGYYCGLINDRDNPHTFAVLSRMMWHVGNQVGLTMHCAIVEAVYISEVDHETATTPQARDLVRH